MARSIAPLLCVQSRGDVDDRHSPRSGGARCISALLVVSRIGPAAGSDRCAARLGATGRSTRGRKKQRWYVYLSVRRADRVRNVRTHRRDYYADGGEAVLMTRSAAEDLT